MNRLEKSYDISHALSHDIFSGLQLGRSVLVILVSPLYIFVLDNFK